MANSRSRRREIDTVLGALSAQPTEGGGRNEQPLKVCAPNGLDAKLHGQGPRAEARAARGAPACEARECAPRDAARF